eukprot:gene5063-3650_t
MLNPSNITELFQLNNVTGGLQPGSISFKNVTIESDKFVCVRDTQPGGSVSLVIVDLEKRESIRNDVRDAEAAIMCPSAKILALRSKRNIQIFDVNAGKRLKAVLFNDDILFWRWLDSRTVGIVTATAVYHWSLDTAADAPPTKVFERGAEYDATVQILSYKTDEAKKWHVLSGVTRDPSGGMVGKSLLFSAENNQSRILEGHACCFISTSTPMESRKCNVMCLARNNGAQGGHVLIMELPTGAKMDITIPRREYPFQLNPGDFPVVMNVSDRHKLLTIVSSRGKYILMDIFTGVVLFESQFTPAVVFCGAADTKLGGVVVVNNQGQVTRLAPDDNSIIDYVKNRLQNPGLALRIASTANLGGVDNLFKDQLENCLRSNDVDGAVRCCLRAPGNSLRRRDILLRFMQLPMIPGQPPAISTYFKIMLAETSLNTEESIELARAVIPKGGFAYVKQQYDENKLTISPELGDLVQPVDPDMAIKIFHKTESHAKVVNVLLQKGDTQKAVEYCKRANYSPDWRVIMSNCVRASPQDAVKLGLMLHRDMGDKPVLEPEEVVDMFVSLQHIQQATEFLLEVLRDHNDASTMNLQTKLLEINLKYSDPLITKRIFERNLCRFYDGSTIAPLCERAGLFQIAVDAYVVAQNQDPDLDILPNVRRCLQQTQSAFNPDWLVEFFGKLNPEDSIKCISDLCENHQQNFKTIVQVATKYNDVLGSKKLIDLFIDKSLYDVLFYYLGAIVPYTRDPEVHFRYIEAAAEMGQTQELERITRESPCYDAERTKNYLKTKELTDLWPFINVCDKHNLFNDMIRYLLDTNNESLIEQYVTRRNPNNTPYVVGAMIECGVNDESIKSVLNAVGSMCPITELIAQVEEAGRLHLIKEWLEKRASEKKTETSLYTALAKIYVDIGQNPQIFLESCELYDHDEVGKYCENRDPNLACIAYVKGHRSQSLIEHCRRTSMFKQLARYLVAEQNLELWAEVLRTDDKDRQNLIEAVQQTALPESTVSEEVSTTVRAFMTANLTEELTTLLDQIVVHGRFRKNRFLENLLIISAIRGRQDKVMEYVTTLEDYDAKDIAVAATTDSLHEVAFIVYDRHNMKKDAVEVLLKDLQDTSRGRMYAQKADEADVWTSLGSHLLSTAETREAIECLIKAKNPNLVDEVVAAAERTKDFSDLIKYLTMARKHSKAKDTKIDTALVLTYAKTGRLAELEAFIKETHNVKIAVIADSCFNDGLYESARILYSVNNNYAKLASTEVKLGNLTAAVEAANKAKSTKTFKEVNIACIEANELKLASVCAVPVVLRAEEVSGMTALYESRGLWEEYLTVLKTASGNQGAHMGIFTEMGVLLAKYKPEKLLEHINMYTKKLSIHRMTSVCEQYHHWVALRLIHIINDDWLAATNVMIKHHEDCWDHEIYKDVVGHLGSSDVLYTSIPFYLKTHPELLNDYLTAVFKKVDPEKVLLEVKKIAPIFFVRSYLEATQERNSKTVNESLNSLYIEEEDFEALRHSVETHSNFDAEELSSRLEKMERMEFRKIALLLHRRNKRFAHAIKVAKENELFDTAIETAAESKDGELVEQLLEFFVRDYPDCFGACLYACYDLVTPANVMQKAWMNGRTDIAMPFMIQVMQDYQEKVDRMEHFIMENQATAKDTARRFGPPQAEDNLGITHLSNSTHQDDPFEVDGMMAIHRKISMLRTACLQLSRIPFSTEKLIMANRRLCYRCGEHGHFAQNCPKPGERCCFNCGETGHMSRECTNEAKPKVCYTCGSTEHLSRDCPNPQLRECYNCGEKGHVVRDCPHEQKPRACFNCGSTEHLSRTCPNKNNAQTAPPTLLSWIKFITELRSIGALYINLTRENNNDERGNKVQCWLLPCIITIVGFGYATPIVPFKGLMGC